MQPIADTLYIGAGNSPGNEDGACILSSTNGAILTSEQELLEQGVHEIHTFGSGLYIPGTDPFESWELGNLYIKQGSWLTRRTLPLTIHSLGCWKDESGLYVVGGMHTGDNLTWKGRVLKSTDEGLNWTATDVNNYRLYDIVKNGNYYVVGYDWTGSNYTQDLHYSSDAITWNKIANLTPAIKPRLIIHNNEVYGINSNFTSIFKINNIEVTNYNLPFTTLNQWNIMDTDGTYLYILSSTGIVYRSSDLTTWEGYTKVSGAISIKYWTGHGLMIGDMGTNARIWIA